MPVSMFFDGSGRKLFGGSPTRLNCVNTRFQISTDLLPSGMKINLAARPAHAVRPLARRTGRPEVLILAAPLDAIDREPDILRPNPGRLVVIRVHRHRQPLRLDAQPLLVREKLPRPVDRIALEVVAEAEVAQHLEKRVVIRRAPDVIDVARPQTLLASRRPRELQLHLAEKVVLELVHAGRREQHRRIPSRHEHIARTPLVPLRFKKRQILFA